MAFSKCSLKPAETAKERKNYTHIKNVDGFVAELISIWAKRTSRFDLRTNLQELFTNGGLECSVGDLERAVGAVGCPTSLDFVGFSLDIAQRGIMNDMGGTEHTFWNMGIISFAAQPSAPQSSKSEAAGRLYSMKLTEPPRGCRR